MVYLRMESSQLSSSSDPARGCPVSCTLPPTVLGPTGDWGREEDRRDGKGDGSRGPWGAPRAPEAFRGRDMGTHAALWVREGKDPEPPGT